MTQNETENVVRFTRMIDAESNMNAYGIAKPYKELVRCSKRLSTIAIHACNGTKYTDDVSYNKAVNTVYSQLNKSLPNLGINWYHQSDPRGVQLYISNVESLTEMNYTLGLSIY